MNRWSLALKLSVLLGVGTIAAPAQAAEVTLAYVDLQKVRDDVAEGKEAFDKLQELHKKTQGDLQSKEAMIVKEEENFKKKLGTLSQDALMKLLPPIQQKRIAFEQLRQKSIQEISAEERKLFAPIEAKVREMVRQVANRDGYDMILSKRSVPFGRKDLDLTDKLIQEYNKQYPAKAAPEKKDSSSAPKNKEKSK